MARGRPRTKFDSLSKRKQPYRVSENLDIEVKMLYDGLDGLLDRFKEFNKTNTKMLEIVESIIKTSFKLGYAVSRKDKFKEITEEEFEKEMSLK